MMDTIVFNKECDGTLAQRTALPTQLTLADYLVNHGVPFRDAHGIIRPALYFAVSQKTSALDDLTLDEYTEESPGF